MFTFGLTVAVLGLIICALALVGLLATPERKDGDKDRIEVKASYRQGGWQGTSKNWRGK